MFTGLDVAVENPARRWTALVSFALQATVVAVAFVYPLLNPQSLPRIMRPVFVPMSRGEFPPRRNQEQARAEPVRAVHPLVVNQRTFTFQRVDHPSEDPAGPSAPSV